MIDNNKKFRKEAQVKLSLIDTSGGSDGKENDNPYRAAFGKAVSRFGGGHVIPLEVLARSVSNKVETVTRKWFVPMGKEDSGLQR